MSKVVKAAVMIVAAAVVIVAAPYIAAAIGTIAGTLGASLSLAAVASISGAIVAMGITMGLTAVMGMFRKTPNMSQALADRLNTSVVPVAPRKIVFGTTAGGQDVRFFEGDIDLRDTKKDGYVQVIALASHRISAFKHFYVENDLVWSNGTWLKHRGGFAPTNPLRIVIEGRPGNGFSVGSGSYWNASASFTGCAYYAPFWKLDEKVWESGIPQRLTAIVDGCPLYDPRRDSTRGGSGAHRIDDQNSWGFTDGGVTIGRNPALALLTYLIGWRINGKLVWGMGIPAHRIDLDNFRTYANVCEERVATQSGTTVQRYTLDGIYSTSDTHETVISGITATMGSCKMTDRGGVYCLVGGYDDTAGPKVAFDADDLVAPANGSSPYVWNPAPASRERFNIVRGRFANPDELFQLTDWGDPIEQPALADGIPRTMSLDLGGVSRAETCQRIAKQFLLREYLTPGMFSATFGPKAFAVEVGSVITLSLPAEGWNAKLFRVIEQAETHDMFFQMTLREEDPAVYAWDRDEKPLPPSIRPQGYDPKTTIAPQNLQLTSNSYAGANDVHVSEVHVTWTPEMSGRVSFIQIQSRPAGTSAWTEQAGTFDPKLGTFTFTSNAPGITVEVQARFRMTSAVYSAWVMANVATAAVVPVAEWENIKDSSGTRPADNATNSADPTSPFGPDKTVGGAINEIATAQQVIDDVKATTDKLIAETVPLLAEADRLQQRGITDLTNKATTARNDIDETIRNATTLKERVDSITAEGGSLGNLTTEIKRVETLALGGDKAVAKTVDEVRTTADQNTADIKTTSDALATAKKSFAEKTDSIEAELNTAGTGIKARLQTVQTAITDGRFAGAQRVSDLEARTSSGGNLLTNTEWATGTDGWNFGSENGSIAARNGITASMWWPTNTNCLVIGQENTSSARGGYWYQTVWGIDPGSTYQFTMYANSHRCLTTAYVDWLDADGNGAGYGGSVDSGRGNNGTRLISEFDRLTVNTKAPANASGMRVYLMKQGTNAGANSYAWYLRPQVVKIDPKTTVAVPYTAGNGSAEQIATDARVKTVETATTDGRFAAASRATSLEATVANIGSSIVKNDKFGFWPDGAPMPANWSTWQGNGNYRVERHGGRGGSPYCIRTLNDHANVDSGFVQSVLMTGPGKYVIEVCVDSDASGLSGAGVTLSGIGGLDINFLRDPDTNGVTGNIPNARRAWSRMVDIGSYDTLSLHAMHGWSAWGQPIAAKYMYWHYLTLRPATDGEILAGKVNNDLNKPDGALARITGLETATTDGRFAAATRVSELEASTAAASNTLNPNPDFSAWSNPAGTPDNWMHWSAVGPIARIANPLARGGYALDHTPSDLESGLVRNDIFVGNGWYVMDVTAWRIRASWNGAGATLSGQVHIDFMVDPDSAGRTGDSNGDGGVRTWTKLFEVSDAYIGPGYKNWHLMGNWSGFGRGFTDKTIRWMRCAIRPATDAEVKAMKADAALNNPGGALARIKNLETVTTNDTFASASRANTIEAQLRREVPSVLNNHIDNVNARIDTVAGTTDRTLRAVIEDRAAAYADDRSGAVARTVSTLRSEYDQTKSTVSIQAGTIAGKQDKTGAVWQILADVGTGRAQLTVAADNYGGRVDIVGDVRIGGNLVVDGSITSSKYAPSSVQQVAFMTLGYDVSVARGGYGGGGYSGGGGGGGGGFNPDMPNQQ